MEEMWLGMCQRMVTKDKEHFQQEIKAMLPSAKPYLATVLPVLVRSGCLTWDQGMLRMCKAPTILSGQGISASPPPRRRVFDRGKMERWARILTLNSEQG